MLNKCEKPIPKSTDTKYKSHIRTYNMGEVLFAGPVVQLGTMYNIGFGVMIDVKVVSYKVTVALLNLI